LHSTAPLCLRSLVLFSLTTRRPPGPPLFPYTTLFRSSSLGSASCSTLIATIRPSLTRSARYTTPIPPWATGSMTRWPRAGWVSRSEEHTSELQSLTNLVCRLLLEKKKKRHTRLGPHDT